MKLHNFQSELKKSMENPEFKDEYETLEKEFALAKEILDLRKKRNLTQKQLAELIGTSQPAIARLESGSYTNVSLAFLRKIATALGAEAEVHFKENTA